MIIFGMKHIYHAGADPGGGGPGVQGPPGPQRGGPGPPLPK